MKPPPQRPDQKRHAFPSARQASCAGLRKEFFPASIRDLVDYDYLKKLSPEERQWLAAFNEEHYRGWRLKSETQVTQLEHIRAADASLKRVLRGADGMAVKRSSVHEVNRGVPRLRRQEAGALGKEDREGNAELHLLAGSRMVTAPELRSRNVVEDELLDLIDAAHAVARVQERIAAASIVPVTDLLDVGREAEQERKRANKER